MFDPRKFSAIDQQEYLMSVRVQLWARSQGLEVIDRDHRNDLWHMSDGEAYSTNVINGMMRRSDYEKIARHVLRMMNKEVLGAYTEVCREYKVPDHRIRLELASEMRTKLAEMLKVVMSIKDEPYIGPVEVHRAALYVFTPDEMADFVRHIVETTEARHHGF